MISSNKKGSSTKIKIVTVIIVFLTAFSGFAQTLPSSADASRIKPLEDKTLPELPKSSSLPDVNPVITVPDAAKEVMFTLQKVELLGVSVFPAEEIAAIYQPYLNEHIPLTNVWMIAGQISQYYQNKGYFLSRAYVPAQEINDGTVIIKVVEGYVEEVDIDNADIAAQPLVQQLVAGITQNRPLSAYNLESFMLQMNGLPGVEFRAVVEPIENAEGGVTRLLLREQKQRGKGLVSIDNFGSRYLGPYLATITYQNNYVPLQRTTLSALTSIPNDELNYFAIRHEIPIYPDWQVEFSANYVTSEPGASLESRGIESDSIQFGIGISWQPIRQRQDNLIVSLEFTGKNSNGDILEDTPLTRDRIRAIRGKLTYDTSDRWNGYNYVTFGVSQGIDIFGASKKGELNLSRSEAEPDFTTAHFSYIRQQPLGGKVLAVGRVSGQLALGPLYSAEEFGYGGQAFGRAYDPSEITGDQGIAASLELRYLGMNRWREMALTPYSFYDIGKVWNKDVEGEDESGSSAGLGLQLKHNNGFSAGVGVAWPLTRNVSTPLYGNGKNPRLLLHMSYGF